MMKKLFLYGLWATLVMLLISCSREAPENDVIDLYLGQAQPEQVSEKFAGDIITVQYEVQNCLTISAVRGEIMYGIYIPEDQINKVYMVRNESETWSEPVRFYPFEEEGISMDTPCFSPDSQRLYFLAKHSVDDDESDIIERIWYVEDEAGVWSEPQVLPEFFDAYNIHMQFSVASDYSIYFKSKHESGVGESDLFVSPYVEGMYEKPVHLSESINTVGNEMTPFIAPDDSYLLFCRNRIDYGEGGADLFISLRQEDGTWSEAKGLGEEINSSYNESCPVVSPDGEYLFFNSNQERKYEIFWIRLLDWI